jgi:hypothetical protein
MTLAVCPRYSPWAGLVTMSSSRYLSTKKCVDKGLCKTFSWITIRLAYQIAHKRITTHIIASWDNCLRHRR